MTPERICHYKDIIKISANLYVNNSTFGKHMQPSPGAVFEQSDMAA